MTDSILPTSEIKRLSALHNYNIMESVAEIEFDDITDLAATVTQSKFATISLVFEERLWFKSKIGLTIESIPRENSFGEYVVHNPKEVLVVTDAANDPRFISHPLVKSEPHIRFYAGAPLIDREGFVLGTLCVFDSEPKSIDEKQLKTLKTLANQVMKFIELKNDSRGYQKFLNHTSDIVFEVDMNGTITFTNQACEKVMGYTPDELIGRNCWDFVEPEIREKAREEMLRTINNCEVSSYHEFAIVTKTGQQKILGQSIDMEFEGEIMKRAYIVSKDITDTVKIREDLKSKEETYRLLSEASGDMVCLHDADGVYQYVSPASGHLLGIFPDELKGKAPGDFIHPDDLKNINGGPQGKMLMFEFPTQTAFRMKHKNGQYIWMEMHIKPIFNENGKIKLIQTSTRDISKRKSYEQELKKINEQQSKYKEGIQALNSIAVASLEHVENQLKKTLKVARKYLGFSIAGIGKINLENDALEIIELEHDNFEHVGDIPNLIPLEGSLSNKILKMDSPFGVTDIANSDFEDNNVLHSLGINSLLTTSFKVDGSVFGIIGFFSPHKRENDFTEYEIEFINLFGRITGELLFRDQNRNNLLAERHILRSFVFTAPAAIAMLDKEFRYIAASRKWYSAFEIKTNIIGKSHYEVFPEIGEDWKHKHQRCLQGEIIKNDDEKFERKDGKIQWLRGEIRPWYNSENKVGGIVIYTDDITTIKQQAEELKRAKELAESSGQIKANFLSTMSHEIRTPLNSIIGTIKLLGIEKPALAENERFQLLEFSSNNLLSLVNDVLDFNKIESGKLELDLRPVDLSELMHNIVSSWKPSANQKDLKINCNKPDMPFGVMADSVRITQIMNNLLSNAVKFTRSGSITVSLKAEPLIGSRTFFDFEVKDTGIGIARDQLNNIFESFHQVINKDTENVSGTGLGLSITKRLVELMGGTIEVTSKEQVGTSFRFNLKLENARLEKIKKVSPGSSSEFADVKVLVVDDNLANQSIATGFLSKWGVASVVANHGEEAIELLAKDRFDIVLMDLRMPIMDGYEATQHIRQMDGNPNQSIPIIALSASPLLDVKDQIIDSGMNDYISKPFSPEVLMEKINKFNLITHKPDEEKDVEPKRWQYLSDLFENDTERINALLKITLESLSASFKKLNTAIDSENKSEAREALHSIRPNLAHLDLHNLANEIPSHESDTFFSGTKTWAKSTEEKIETIRQELKLN